MSTDLVLHYEPEVTAEQMDLIKRTVAKDATADELKLFFFDCKRQGVHPLDKLIHFTKRGGKYTPVTSIDFMRSRAADSNEYAGSDDAVFHTNAEERFPESATVTVYRLVQGQRCSFTATARWSEYVPEQAFMWKKMPYTMLGKCAEALALRKAFPRQLAGLYSAEEMDQAKRSKDAESQTWESAEEKQAIVERKKAELQPPDEPATEADEIKGWKTLIAACKTAADFNALIPKVKDKPNVVKMALMTASLEAGLGFDKATKQFYSPEPEKASPAPSNVQETPSHAENEEFASQAIAAYNRAHPSTSKIGRKPAANKGEPRLITKHELDYLFKLWGDVGWKEEQQKNHAGRYGFESRKDITYPHPYREMCEELEQYARPGDLA